jgi:hypothetical protein
MALRVYIANEDGSDPVYLEGVSTPWPEEPATKQQRRGAVFEMIPGWDEDTNKAIAGRTVTVDAGTHPTNRKIEVVCFALATLEADLREKYDRIEPVQYSPDDGENIWLVAWRPNEESLDVEPEPGFPGKYRVVMKFSVITKL